MQQPDPAIDAAGEATLVPFRGCGLGGSIRWPKDGGCMRCGRKLTDETMPFTLGHYKGQTGHVCRQCARKETRERHDH